MAIVRRLFFYGLAAGVFVAAYNEFEAGNILNTVLTAFAVVCCLRLSELD